MRGYIELKTLVRLGFRVLILDVYSRSPKVGNPIASILKTNV